MPRNRKPKLTPEERALLAKLGSIGGTLSSKRMTHAERVERAKKAGLAAASNRRERAEKHSTPQAKAGKE